MKVTSSIFPLVVWDLRIPMNGMTLNSFGISMFIFALRVAVVPCATQVGTMLYGIR